MVEIIRANVVILLDSDVIGAAINISLFRCAGIFPFRARAVHGGQSVSDTCTKCGNINVLEHHVLTTLPLALTRA